MNNIVNLWHRSLSRDDTRWWEWEDSSRINMKIGLTDLVVNSDFVETSHGMITLGEYEIEIVGYNASVFKVKDLKND